MNVDFSVLHSVYEVLGMADGSNKAQGLLEKMDMNKNGVVEKQEFLKSCETGDNKMIF